MLAVLALVIVLMAFSSRSSFGVEDQIEFRDANGAPRVLRGKITRETETTITVSRMDGEYELSRAQVTKIVRRTPRPIGIVNTIRGKIEASAQKQFVQMIEDIKAGALNDRQIADRADVDLTTVARVRALIAAQEAT